MASGATNQLVNTMGIDKKTAFNAFYKGWTDHSKERQPNIPEAVKKSDNPQIKKWYMEGYEAHISQKLEEKSESVKVA